MQTMQSCICCHGSGLLLPGIVCPLCDGVPGWPESEAKACKQTKESKQNKKHSSHINELPSVIEMNCSEEKRHGPFRAIRAICDAKSVRVYQAYNENIAKEAVAANSFRGPLETGIWSPTRMTWIKPSAVWMAYRCGWTVLKDKNQASVLALDLSRWRFERLLMSATLSHGAAPGSTKTCPVVVQWDPERFMGGQDVLTSSAQGIRSIQIGLRGEAVQELLDPEFVLKITDVTADFRAAHRALSSNDLPAAAAALWPRRHEEYMDVPPELREVLQMSD